jgi:hypothetical protein
MMVGDPECSRRKCSIETILEAQSSYMQQSAWDGGRVMLTMRVDCAFLVSV